MNNMEPTTMEQLEDAIVDYLQSCSPRTVSVKELAAFLTGKPYLGTCMGSLQSANAVSPQPSETTEESANIKGGAE